MNWVFSIDFVLLDISAGQIENLAEYHRPLFEDLEERCVVVIVLKT